MPPASTGCLLDLPFKPDDRSEIFLRNVEVGLHDFRIQKTIFCLDFFSTCVSGVGVEKGTFVEGKVIPGLN
jgi:hypothetical protein